MTRPNRRHLFQTLGSFALRAGAAACAATALQAAGGRTAEEIAADEDFWRDIRTAFTVDRNVLNFNNGSLCPAPRVVQEAMNRYWEITNMQPSFYADEVLGPQTEVVRRELARAFGCDPEELALTRNTSEAMHNVIFGIRLNRGDEVITTTQDYPSMITAFQQRERRDGIVLKQFAYPTPPPSEADLVERFRAAITPRTKVLLVSHLTFTTGQIFPVAAICKMAREKGIISIVDGAHGFAHFPFRGPDLDCDFYATSLHKWLLAPVGTGFLYVRRERIKEVWPLMGAPAALDNDIRKFESTGTIPLAMRDATTEALAFHEAIGPERKAARLRYLRRRWEHRLAQHPRIALRNNDDPAQSCAIAGVTVKGLDSGKLTDLLLARYRIHVRPRFVPGEYAFDCIRVTPNIYTSLTEVDRFCEAVERIASEKV
ncbi:MAG: aminotransferase class V-fold PLP-dependent enzyme [Bryobacteraceae bacterium]